MNTIEKKRRPHPSYNTGKNNEWYTPQYIIDAARKTMGSIDLDPASSEIANKTVQASTYYTKEDFVTKDCWVRSGGVNSAFYMYRNKEIRIQVAASKFQGSGNSKSKSALCVILPFPKFLHKNCIKTY